MKAGRMEAHGPIAPIATPAALDDRRFACAGDICGSLTLGLGRVQSTEQLGFWALCGI